MHAIYNNTHNTYKNKSKHSEMGPVRQWTTVLVDQCTEYRFWDMSIISLADVSSVIEECLIMVALCNRADHYSFAL